MQLVAQSQVDLREIGSTISSGTLPINIASSSFTNVVFTAVTVPNEEMWQVLFYGFSVEVDNGLLAPTNSAAGFAAVASLTSFAQGFGRIPVIPNTGGGNTLTSGERQSGLPVSISTVSGGPGGGWFYGSVSLQGVLLWPGDKVYCGIRITNSDAGASHNITDGYAGLRIVPLRLTPEIAQVQLVQQQIDANLVRRLAR